MSMSISHLLLLAVVAVLAAFPLLVQSAGREQPVLYQGPETTLVKRPLNKPRPPQSAIESVDDSPDPAMVQRGVLPVRTLELTPARIEPAQFSGALVPMPICVIGSDDFSVAWLAARRELLAQVGAFCRLVQAETIDDVRRVRRAAGAVLVYPGNGADLASYYGLRHYPVLISKDWVEQ